MSKDRLWGVTIYPNSVTDGEWYEGNKVWTEDQALEIRDLLLATTTLQDWNINVEGVESDV
jgi:hypothetical protein